MNKTTIELYRDSDISSTQPLVTYGDTRRILTTGERSADDTFAESPSLQRDGYLLYAGDILPPRREDVGATERRLNRGSTGVTSEATWAHHTRVLRTCVGFSPQERISEVLGLSGTARFQEERADYFPRAVTSQGLSAQPR